MAASASWARHRIVGATVCREPPLPGRAGVDAGVAAPATAGNRAAVTATSADSKTNRRCGEPRRRQAPPFAVACPMKCTPLVVS